MEATGSSETLVHFTRLHGVMSQRAAVFIVTVVVDHISQKKNHITHSKSYLLAPIILWPCVSHSLVDFLLLLSQILVHFSFLPTLIIRILWLAALHLSDIWCLITSVEASY